MITPEQRRENFERIASIENNPSLVNVLLLSSVLQYVARQPNKRIVAIDYRRYLQDDTYYLFTATCPGWRYPVTLWANVPESDLSTLKGIAILANEFARLNTSTVNAKALYRIACNILRVQRSMQRDSIWLSEIAAFDNALSVLAVSYPTIVKAAKESI